MVKPDLENASISEVTDWLGDLTAEMIRAMEALQNRMPGVDLSDWFIAACGEALLNLSEPTRPPDKEIN